jgi:hypothetical protein
MLAWKLVVEASHFEVRLVDQCDRPAFRSQAVARSRLSERERVPGQRARAETDPFEEYVSCCRLRLSGDPRVWLTTLFEEVAQLGYAGSYQSFTRAIRTRRRDRGVRHAGGPGSYTTLPVAVHVAGGRDATLTEGR